MSSFYGNGFYGSGGNNSGTGSDSGITTLIGTETAPIILSTLDSGNYVIEGYYLYTSQDVELKQDTGGLNFFVTYDITTDQKIGKWESYDNSIFYIDIITFQSDEQYTIDKISISNSGQYSDSNIIFTNILPTVGEENVLYITDDGIFRYINNEYLNLSNQMNWGEF